MTQAQPETPQLPGLLQRHEGPFREMDLLAIGSVLVVVLVILGVRRLRNDRD